jgi:riboflavin kinase / FMN adenylyltransferase
LPGRALPAARFILAIDPLSPPAGLDGAVAAIGNFDGVHRGHRAVIKRAEALALRLGRPCAVVTFEPHPSDFFLGRDRIFRLTPCDTKALILERLGVQGMIVLDFDAELAALSADAFVEEVLVGRLGLSAVVAGYDFHFGRGRSGTPNFLAETGPPHGLEVEIVPPILADESGSIAAVSSTAIRQALELGDVERAAHLLGHPYFVIGEVIHGDKRGAGLGFPTANLRLDPSNRLRHGIYAVDVKIGETHYGGVASFGRRPTFDDGPPLLEVFIFDFSGDLYGRMLEVAFRSFIRAEEKFSSIEGLKAQMRQDEAAARDILRR